MSLTVENLSFSYGDRPILRGLTFEARPGELLSVLGPNGVGKSTLFRCMLGLLRPREGRTCIDGRDIFSFPKARLARCIAYIPQSHNPVFNFSVFDVVLMGTTAQTGALTSPGKAQQALAQRALERLGISHLAARGYASLSGGERQLVLIARALSQEARILIMDEPSSSLDFGNRLRVMEVIRSLTEEGYTVIQSTHDPEEAYRVSHRILALREGRIEALGPPSQVLTNHLISALYGVEVEVCSLCNDGVRVCIPKNGKEPVK